MLGSYMGCLRAHLKYDTYVYVRWIYLFGKKLFMLTYANAGPEKNTIFTCSCIFWIQFLSSSLLLHFRTDKWYSSMHCFLYNLIQWAWRQHCSTSSFMFASFPALRQNTHMIGVLVLKLLNTISASMSELKRAPWEHLLVQVLGRWVEGNGDQEMFNISETLHKCPRTKDTCQLPCLLMPACYLPNSPKLRNIGDNSDSTHCPRRFRVAVNF